MSTTNEAKVNMDSMEEMPMPSISNIRTNTNVICELVVERLEVSQKLSKLERAIESDPASVSDYHKMLWNKQAEAMRAYKEVLGERIKDLID